MWERSNHKITSTATIYKSAVIVIEKPQQRTAKQKRKQQRKRTEVMKRKMPEDRERCFTRINEILNDYWISEPEELFISAEFTFVKANGECQQKYIKWFNPEYEVIEEQPKQYRVPRLPQETRIDECTGSTDDLIPYLKEIKDGKIRRKNKQ